MAMGLYIRPLPGGVVEEVQSTDDHQWQYAIFITNKKLLDSRGSLIVQTYKDCCEWNAKTGWMNWSTIVP